MRHTIAVDCLLIADDLTGCLRRRGAFCDARYRAGRGIGRARSECRRGAHGGDQHGEPRSSGGRNPPRDVRGGGGVSSGLRGARLQEDRFHFAGQHGRGNRRRDGSVRLRCGRGVPGVSQTESGGGGRTAEGDERAGICSHRCGRAACRFRPGLRVRMFVPEGIAAILSEGMRLVSVEASCDLDLDCIAAAILPMGRRVLWAGSAGLASALARAIGGACVPPAAPARSGAALFCIGSDHGVTLAQQAALLAERRAMLFHPEGATRESIGDALAKRKARDPADSARRWSRWSRCANRSPECPRRPWYFRAEIRHRWSAGRPECSASSCVMKSLLEFRAAFSREESSTEFRSRPSPAVSAIAIR